MLGLLIYLVVAFGLVVYGLRRNSDIAIEVGTVMVLLCACIDFPPY